MKFLIPALAIIGLFIAIVGSILYAQVKISNQFVITPKPTPVAVSTSSIATGTIFTPPAFHGPTAQPHIIGPSANPPNY